MTIQDFIEAALVESGRPDDITEGARVKAVVALERAERRYFSGDANDISESKRFRLCIAYAEEIVRILATICFELAPDPGAGFGSLVECVHQTDLSDCRRGTLHDVIFDEKYRRYYYDDDYSKCPEPDVTFGLAMSINIYVEQLNPRQPVVSIADKSASDAAPFSGSSDGATECANQRHMFIKRELAVRGWPQSNLNVDPKTLRRYIRGQRIRALSRQDILKALNSHLAGRPRIEELPE